MCETTHLYGSVTVIQHQTHYVARLTDDPARYATAGDEIKALLALINRYPTETHVAMCDAKRQQAQLLKEAQ